MGGYDQCSNSAAYADAVCRCKECGQPDTIFHLIWCAGYKALRDGKDLGDDKQLCNYLHKFSFQEIKSY